MNDSMATHGKEGKVFPNVLLKPVTYFLKFSHFKSKSPETGFLTFTIFNCLFPYMPLPKC